MILLNANAQDTAQAPDEQSQNENEDLTEGLLNLLHCMLFHSVKILFNKVNIFPMGPPSLCR